MSAALGRDLVSLWAHVPEQAAAEFAQWHARTREPALVALPAVARVLRYAIPDRPGDFLTWIEAAEDAAAADRAVREARSPAPGGYSEEIVSLALKCDVGDRQAADTPWLYIVHTDIPDEIVDEYNQWYDNEHLPRLVTVPGVVRARRYTAVTGTPKYLTAYSLTDKDAFESPDGLRARKTPWTARMRSLFQNTRRSMCRLA